jgi:hypothetical protein
MWQQVIIPSTRQPMRFAWAKGIRRTDKARRLHRRIRDADELLFINLLNTGTQWHPAAGFDGVFEGRSRRTNNLKWTGTRVDLIFGSHSQLRALAADSKEKFVKDFVAAWTNKATASILPGLSSNFSRFCAALKVALRRKGGCQNACSRHNRGVRPGRRGLFKLRT